MTKKTYTVEQMLVRYKRRFFILLGLFTLFLAVLGTYIFMNFDYLAFKHLLAQNYIYTETLDKLFKSELDLDVKGRYYSHFDDLVIAVVTKQVREVNGDKYTYLYIPEQYKQHFVKEKQDAAKSEIRALTADTVYMRITNFSKYTRQFLESGIPALRKYKNLIVDLRGNYGGDIDEMNRMAGHFLKKGSVIATDKMRITNWTYKAGGGRKLTFSRIAILQDGNTASAAECFSAALKDNLSHVLLIGEKTFGKGIGQFTMPLRRGYAVKATTLLWYSPGGKNIQGKGLSPDIEYTGTNILDEALRQME